MLRLTPVLRADRGRWTYEQRLRLRPRDVSAPHMFDAVLSLPSVRALVNRGPDRRHYGRRRVARRAIGPALGARINA